jgi:hypothetical protein
VNNFQLTVLIAALANLALLLLFPPFDSQPLGLTGAPTFDAFYPVFDWPVKGVINSGLLYLEVFSVLVNATLAWLLLQGPPQRPSMPRFRWQGVLQWMVVADLLLMLLFPPFETRPVEARLGERAFEGFAFVLSGSVQRGIFMPLLFMEFLLLALNATTLWLAFGLIDRGREASAAQSPGMPGPERGQIGRSGADRRQRRDPSYRGPERRSGTDRRDRR